MLEIRTVIYLINLSNIRVKPINTIKWDNSKELRHDLISEHFRTNDQTLDM